MSRYELVVDATQVEFDRHIGTHPIIPHVMSGNMSREQYTTYLRETYHMVRHTPRMLALAAAKCEDSYRGLRNWFIEQTEEENGHDLFCLKDLRHLGQDADEVVASGPLPGAWGLVCQNYFMATYGNPAGILGVASITEGLGATTAGGMADILVSAYGLGTDCVTFLRSHSGFDAKHLEETKRAINDLVTTDEDQAAVIHGRRMTIFYYARMFSDCLENPYEGSMRPSGKKVVEIVPA